MQANLQRRCKQGAPQRPQQGVLVNIAWGKTAPARSCIDKVQCHRLHRRVGCNRGLDQIGMKRQYQRPITCGALWKNGQHIAITQRNRHLAHHAQRGAVFESWVASELVKQRWHAGLERDLSFYRDRKGREVDLVLERGRKLDAIEVKSGQTAVGDWFDSLESFDELVAEHGVGAGSVRRIVVYGGDQRQVRERGLVLPWSSMADEDWGA